jgi:hypothetical protein
MTRRLGVTGAGGVIDRRSVARAAAGKDCARAFGRPVDGGSKARRSIAAGAVPSRHGRRLG